jgi:hypothetical protein
MEEEYVVLWFGYQRECKGEGCEFAGLVAHS